MKNIFFFTVFISSALYSQNNYTNTRDSIYLNDGLFYNITNNSIFDGSIEFINKNGVIKSKELYVKGVLKKVLFYYNKSAKGKVYLEIHYNYESPNSYKQKEIYFSSSEEIYKINYFELGNLYLIELYENGKIYYSCDYRNGKKHGSEICYDKKNDLIQFQYENGKKVKN